MSSLQILADKNSSATAKNCIIRVGPGNPFLAEDCRLPKFFEGLHWAQAV